MTISATPEVSATYAAQETLVSVMERAGWEIDFVDLDLSGVAPTVDIRVRRFDGLWFRAHVDHVGRATVERFHRKITIGLSSHQKGTVPRGQQIEDTFIGRARYEGPRSMLRGMCSYLSCNALRHVSVSDMKAAWGMLMQSPARIDRCFLGSGAQAQAQITGYLSKDVPPLE